MKTAYMVLALILILTACAKQSTTGQVTQTPPSGGATYNIAISNFAFSPSDQTIRVGDTVVWTNNDPLPHSVTSDSGSELSSSDLSTGRTYSHTFNTPGVFTYHCGVHPNMKGQITVQ
jgi:plastocyanin